MRERYESKDAEDGSSYSDSDDDSDSEEGKRAQKEKQGCRVRPS